MRCFNLTVAALLALLALASGLIGGALALSLLILLLPLMVINHFVHERNLRQLDSEGYDEEISSDEFGERTDVVGGILRTIPLLPLGPALDISEKCREFLAKPP